MLKDINEIPQDIFIKSVLAATHEAYNRDRKKIKHTKSVKLVLAVAEKSGYTQLGHGYYKYGHFSFRVFEQMNTVFTFQSLHGLKRDKTVNVDLIEYIIPTIIELNERFLSNFNVFMHEAHSKDVPEELVKFYANTDSFERVIRSLTKKNKGDLPLVYDKFKEKISKLDPNLTAVQKEYLDIYFNFTDLFEGLLLVCKYRSVNATIVKNIISDLATLYSDNISFLLFPYLETLHGGDSEYEIKKYNSAIANKLKRSVNGLSEINNKILKYGLKPTVEELDKEIHIEMSKMSDKERSNLINCLTI